MKKDKNGYYRHTFTFDGKRYSVSAKSQKDLWSKVALKQAALKTGQLTHNGNMLVKIWLSEYLKLYKKNKITPAAYNDLCSYVKNHITPYVGHLRLKDVKPVDLQNALNHLQGKSLSLTAKVSNILKNAFRTAMKNKMILDNPAEYLVLPSVTQGTHRPITNTERKYILRLCETHRAGLWILIMLYCGLRPVECRNLTYDCIDYENRCMSVQSAKNKYGVRKVPIPPHLLSRLLSEPNQTGFVLTRPCKGGQHTKASMLQMWESFKRELDISMGAQVVRVQGSKKIEKSVVADDLTPYCLRHTYGTDLQTAGVPINIAKEFMGHENLETTSKIYTHLSEEAFEESSRKISKLQKNNILYFAG